MKNNKLSILLCLSIFFSCGSIDQQPQQLLHAAEMMEVAPDSALILLEDFAQSPKLKNRSTLAWYALLLTQSYDKNYIHHTSDSLISIAVNFYDSVSNTALQAKSHYYMGRVYQDMNYESKAVREFMLAMPLAEKAQDDELLCILKCNLGYAFYQQGMYEQADSLYFQAKQLAIQKSDSCRLGVALSMIGNIGIAKGEKYYSSAESNLLSALAIAEKNNNLNSKIFVTNLLSLLYNRMGDALKAISFSKLGISLQTDTVEHHNYYLIQGTAFYKLAQYDSATIYLNRSLFSNNYFIKAGAYMCLSDIAREQGKTVQALRMEDSYHLYMDSTEQSKSAIEVISSVKDVLIQQKVYHYESFLNRYQSIIYALAIVLLIILGILVFRFKKYRLIISQVRKLEEKINYKDTEYIKLHQNNICQNALLIEKRKHCINMESQINQMEAEIERFRLENTSHSQGDIAFLTEQIKLVIAEKERLFREILKGTSIYKQMLKTIKFNYENPDQIKKISDADLNRVKMETNSISIDFTTRLSRKHELLTKNDIYFCCLIKTGLRYSELALLLGCTPSAVYKRRDTILKKMDLASLEISIENYIGKI